MDKKLFTAERQRLALRGVAPVQSHEAGDQPSPVEIMRAIQSLRDEVKAVAHFLNPQVEEEVDEAERVAAERLQHERAEVGLLRTELRALANSIQQTKAEIAALRPADSEEDRLIAVTYELDAIVTATERATQSILDAAERIDHLAASVRAQVTDSYIQHQTDEIRETIITVFEACNFQDITGQRITKVVNTLKYVESRVNAMIDIWGEESFHDLPTKQDAPQEEDWEKQLLNGPQLENKGISQDEIDKLFG
jgi:chemotaxis protein CheZ